MSFVPSWITLAAAELRPISATLATSIARQRREQQKLVAVLHRHWMEGLGAEWIFTTCAPRRLPEFPNGTRCVLLLIDHRDMDIKNCPTVVGFGWRKWDSGGNPTGWFETDRGTMRDEMIIAWRELPPAPTPKRVDLDVVEDRQKAWRIQNQGNR